MKGLMMNHGAWRNRVLAAGVVGLFVGMLRHVTPEPAIRREWLCLIALPMGYGHLLGAAIFSRRRHARRRTSLLAMAFAVVMTLNLLAAYSWALRTDGLGMFVLVAVLLISAWHIAENDLALEQSYGNELRLGHIPRVLGHHIRTVSLMLLVGFLALTTASGARFSRYAFGELVVETQTIFSLEELATAVVMYHAVSWIVFFEDRARTLPERAAWQLRRRLFWFHAIPLASNGVLYVGLPSIYIHVASPTLYLFWSVLHAFQTAVVRGLEPRHAARAAWIAG